MKKILLLYVLLTLPIYASIPIYVEKIYDGDTIKVKIDNGNEFFIRLKGIDCYETSKIHRAYKQAYQDKIDIDEVIKKGKEAKKYLISLYRKTSKASFDFMGIDKYGRIVGVVYFDDLNVNKKLLENNMCKSYEFKEEKNEIKY